MWWYLCIGAIPLHKQISSKYEPVATNVQCVEKETNISNCNFITNNVICNRYAGVVCQGKITLEVLFTSLYNNRLFLPWW